MSPQCKQSIPLGTGSQISQIAVRPCLASVMIVLVLWIKFVTQGIQITNLLNAIRNVTKTQWNTLQQRHLTLEKVPRIHISTL